MSAYHTRETIGGANHLPIEVTIKVRPTIVRRGPPVVGSLFFDAADRLIFITGGFYLDPQYNRLSNHWTWRRVFIDGRLSDHEYNGYWKWGDSKTLERAAKAPVKATRQAPDRPLYRGPAVRPRAARRDTRKG